MATTPQFPAVRLKSHALKLLNLLLFPILAGCLARPLSTPTATSVQTNTPTIMTTPIPVATDTPTLGASGTPTLHLPSMTSTTQPPSPTPTLTTASPTTISDPNQLVSGQQIWRLIALEKRHALEDIGFLLTPQQFNQSPKTYQFLVFEFECTTGASLLHLYGGDYAELNYAHSTSGFVDLFVTDKIGQKFLVTMLAPCWLAAPVPKDSSGYTLYFKELLPLTPTFVARTIHRTPTPEFQY